jgi:hypothetical protein
LYGVASVYNSCHCKLKVVHVSAVFNSELLEAVLFINLPVKKGLKVLSKLLVALEAFIDVVARYKVKEATIN